MTAKLNDQPGRKKRPELTAEAKAAAELVRAAEGTWAVTAVIVVAPPRGDLSLRDRNGAAVTWRQARAATPSAGPPGIGGAAKGDGGGRHRH